MSSRDGTPPRQQPAGSSASSGLRRRGAATFGWKDFREIMSNYQKTVGELVCLYVFDAILYWRVMDSEQLSRSFFLFQRTCRGRNVL